MKATVTAVDVHNLLCRRSGQSCSQPNDALLKMNDVRLQLGKQIARMRPSRKILRTPGANEMTFEIRAVGDRSGLAVCKHKFCGHVFGIEIIRDCFTNAQRSPRDCCVPVMNHRYAKWSCHALN